METALHQVEEPQQVVGGGSRRLAGRLLQGSPQCAEPLAGVRTALVARQQFQEAPGAFRPHRFEPGQLRLDGFAADLAQLVEGDQRFGLARRFHPGGGDQAAEQFPVVHPHRRAAEPEVRQGLEEREQHFRVRDEGAAPNDVCVALGELAEPSALRPVRPPDRLDLVPPEHGGEFAAVLGHHPRERDGEVVAETEFREIAPLDRGAREGALEPSAPVEHPVDEPVPFLAVLPE